MAQSEEARLRDEVVKLKELLAEAQETIAYLEGNDNEGDEPWLQLAETRGLAPVDLKLLRALYDCRGIATTAYLEERLWGDHLPGPDCLKVRICILRRKLGGYGSLDTIRATGFRMTQATRALVRQWLVAASREAA